MGPISILKFGMAATAMTRLVIRFCGFTHFQIRPLSQGACCGLTALSVLNAPVRLVRVDAPNRYQATTTYTADSVNSDSQWEENFVIDDVDPGFYEVIVDTGVKKFTAEVWVFPYRTSTVEIVLQN